MKLTLLLLLQGIRIKICPNGDILAKRLSKADVFWHQLVARPTGDHEPDPFADNFYGHFKSGDYSDAYGPKQPARAPMLHNNKTTTTTTSGSNNLLQPVSSGGSSSSSSGIVVSSASYGLAAGNKLDKAPKRAYKSLALEFGKPVKIFDMQKFKQILQLETSKPVPNKSRLERLCISVVAFVMDDNSVLNLPSWIMVINIVAIDLLKNALGLSQTVPDLPRDHLGQRPYASAGYRSVGDTKLAGYVASEQPLVAAAAAASGQPDNKCQAAKSSQIAASKKAFAAAAASGAYNRALATGGCQFDNNNQADDYLQRDDGRPPPSPTLIDNPGGRPRNFGALAQSAAAFALKRSQQQNRTKQHVGSAGSGNKPEQQVPPRLPSRLATSRQTGNVQAAKSFPIPPPPTSPGTGPSGKANLILVSPTGLSPPLPKRKGKAPQQPGLSQAINAGSQYQVPEFSTIKHIDENGKCSLLVDNNTTGSGPPAGIPRHAKLAPPETQKHILRYLMSATRDRIVDLNRPSKYPAIKMATGQRPLPIIPSQQQRLQQVVGRPDERSLYYCGLQARVASAAAQGQRQLKPRQPAFGGGRLQCNSNSQYCGPSLGVAPRFCSSSTCDISLALSNLRTAYGPNALQGQIGARRNDVKSPSGSLSISADNLTTSGASKRKNGGGSILGQVGSAFGTPFRLLTFRGSNNGNNRAKDGRSFN